MNKINIIKKILQIMEINQNSWEKYFIPDINALSNENKFFNKHKISGKKEYQINNKYLSNDIISDVINNRHSTQVENQNSKLDKKTIFEILFNSLGVNRESKKYKKWEYYYRRYPSGGGIYPIIIYFFIWNVVDLENGWYIYNIESSKITFLKQSNNIFDLQKLSPVYENKNLEKKSICTLFLMNDLKNSIEKYSFNGIRLSLIECGHIAQNILLQTTYRRIKSLPIGGFYNDLVKKQLNINDDLINLDYMIHIG